MEGQKAISPQGGTPGPFSCETHSVVSMHEEIPTACDRSELRAGMRNLTPMGSYCTPGRDAQNCFKMMFEYKKKNRIKKKLSTYFMENRN